MSKKLFALLFLLSCGFVFLASQKHFWERQEKTINVDNREDLLEEAFPGGDTLREVYGVSSRLLSPYERVTGTTATIKSDGGFLEGMMFANPSAENFAKEKVSELNEVCAACDTPFTFVYYPSKSNADTLAEEYGVETNSEEFRSDFIAHLQAENIDYLDMRTLFESEGLTREEIFYKTDHHWTTASGFRAARAIAEHLNAQYGYCLDTAALAEDRFTYTDYPNLWLGETGRSVSLAWVNTLDDFTLIMPSYETAITLSNPDEEDISGDFSVMLNFEGLEGGNDLYDYSAHYAYSKGMKSPTTYRNDMADENGRKILLIKDSFSITVVPFLILETSEVTVWDMRAGATKNGLYDYIRENDFDAVVLAYTDYWVNEMWNFN